MLIVVAAGLFVLGSIFLDSYREDHAKREVAAVLNSPEVRQAQFQAIDDQIMQLCMAKGYSEKQCEKKLNTSEDQSTKNVPVSGDAALAAAQNDVAAAAAEVNETMRELNQTQR